MANNKVVMVNVPVGQGAMVSYPDTSVKGYAQSFYVPESGLYNGIGFYFHGNTMVTPTMCIRILSADIHGMPSHELTRVEISQTDTMPTSLSLFNIDFPSPLKLSANVRYFIELPPVGMILCLSNNSLFPATIRYRNEWQSSFRSNRIAFQIYKYTDASQQVLAEAARIAAIEAQRIRDQATGITPATTTMSKNILWALVGIAIIFLFPKGKKGKQ